MITVIKENSKASFTTQEVTTSLSQNTLRKAFPANVLILSIKSDFMLDGRRAASIVYKRPFDGAKTFDGKDKMIRSKNYVTYYKNYSIVLGFSITGSSEEFVDSLYRYNDLLFEKIAKSIVVKDKNVL